MEFHAFIKIKKIANDPSWRVMASYMNKIWIFCSSRIITCEPDVVEKVSPFSNHKGRVCKICVFDNIMWVLHEKHDRPGVVYQWKDGEYNNIKYKDVRLMCNDKEKLWMCTDNRTILCLNAAGNVIHKYEHDRFICGMIWCGRLLIRDDDKIFSYRNGALTTEVEDVGPSDRVNMVEHGTDIIEWNDSVFAMYRNKRKIFAEEHKILTSHPDCFRSYSLGNETWTTCDFTGNIYLHNTREMRVYSNSPYIVNSMCLHNGYIYITNNMHLSRLLRWGSNVQDNLIIWKMLNNSQKQRIIAVAYCFRCHRIDRDVRNLVLAWV